METQFERIQAKLDEILGLIGTLCAGLARSRAPDAFAQGSLCEAASLRLIENLWGKSAPPTDERSFVATLRLCCGIDVDLVERIHETHRLHIQLCQIIDTLNGKKSPTNS